MIWKRQTTLEQLNRLGEGYRPQRLRQHHRRPAVQQTKRLLGAAIHRHGGLQRPSAAGVTGDNRMIWKRQTTLEQLNRLGEGNMVGPRPQTAVTRQPLHRLLPGERVNGQRVGMVFHFMTQALLEIIG
jgi:hypothetical protein